MLLYFMHAHYHTHSNLWNVLIIGTWDFNYSICSNSWNEWIFEKKLTILIVGTGTLYSVFLLQNLSHLCWQLLTPGNIQSALTEGHRHRILLAPCKSKQLTVFIHAYWWVLCWIGRLLVSQSQTLSSYAGLFVTSVLHINCSPTNLTRDTHCADLVPRMSAFAICLISLFPKLRLLCSQSMCPGNQTSITCKSGYFCNLELARAKSVLVLRYSCNFSAVGCSQVELPYQ